jgi:hypothetical protein
MFTGVLLTTALMGPGARCTATGIQPGVIRR